MRALAVGFSFVLCACNAILGIDAPKERPGSDDEVPFESPADDGTNLGGTQLTEDGSSDDPEEPSAAPSPYAWPRWRMPNPASVTGVSNPQTFSSKTDVIVDSVTQLTWQKVATYELRAHAAAASYCAGLSIDGGGFRLPSRIELLSLVDYTQSNPSIDPKSFPDAPLGKYWTASPKVGSDRGIWLVNFEFSTTLVVAEPEEQKNLARCVRSDDVNIEAASPHFVSKGETVEDKATQLVWQRATSPKAFSNTDAARYCAGLMLSGGGFRLPTIKELHTLVDESRSQPAADSAFPDTPAQAFWSSSTLANFVQYAWSVDFGDGSDSWFPSDSLLRARCVR